MKSAAQYAGAPMYPGSPSGSSGPPVQPVYFQQNQVPQPFLYPPPQIIHQQQRNRYSNNPGNFQIHTGFIGMPVRPQTRASRGQHIQQHMNHYPSQRGGQMSRFNPRSQIPRGDAPIVGFAPQPNQLTPSSTPTLSQDNINDSALSHSEEQLTLSKLMELPFDAQNSFLGEKLFPLVEQLEQDLAGKITGMLLDKLQHEDNKGVLEELWELLSNPQALKNGVNEAVQVLRTHANDSTDQPV